MTFDEVIGTYLDAKRQQTSSLERNGYSVANLQPFFGGRYIPDLKRADVRKYISHRLLGGVKESTVRRELRIFSAAINFYRLEFDRPDLPNPVAALGLSEGEPRVRWLTREEATKLITVVESNSIRPHLPAFIRLALNTGCRKGELLNLEWSRVDLDRSVFLLEAKHTKSRKRRAVPLNDDAIRSFQRLKEWQEQNGLETPFVFGWEKGKITTFKTGWATALKLAKIEDFRIHDLRHTFASWLVMQGESLYVVKELLGHSSVTVTERYAHLAPQQSIAAVQRMMPF